MYHPQTYRFSPSPQILRLKKSENVSNIPSSLLLLFWSPVWKNCNIGAFSLNTCAQVTYNKIHPEVNSQSCCRNLCSICYLFPAECSAAEANVLDTQPSRPHHFLFSFNSHFLHYIWNFSYEVVPDRVSVFFDNMSRLTPYIKTFSLPHPLLGFWIPVRDEHAFLGEKITHCH